jgi:hypothetical protein
MTASRRSEPGRDRFVSGRERASFRAVDPIESDPRRSTFTENGDGVAVRDADDFAGEGVRGERGKDREGEQEAKERTRGRTPPSRNHAANRFPHRPAWRSGSSDAVEPWKHSPHQSSLEARAYQGVTLLLVLDHEHQLGGFEIARTQHSASRLYD